MCKRDRFDKIEGKLGNIAPLARKYKRPKSLKPLLIAVSTFLNVLNKLDITSIKELADLTGLDQATCSRHYHRKQPLSHEHMEIYSKVLNVQLGKLQTMIFLLILLLVI